LTDPASYKLATDVERSIHMEANHLQVGGQTFSFEFSAMERQLIELGGITQAFQKHGKTLFQTMVKPPGPRVFNNSSDKATTLNDNRRC
ncbi:hypothetical protein BDU57DRAFT_443974, partial [Ampelomyces quisqualis]